jgi:glycosyltransferase involved in cell wall biosynthesis
VLLNRGVGRALNAASPDAILCGGYSYVASWQALLWARSHKIPFFLWSESNLQDRRRGHLLVESLKTEFLGKCDGFVVPGRSALEYLRAKGIKEDIIFTAPNAVDNRMFAAAAAAVRQNADSRRRELDLPGRYFLFVGRLVREKGVFDLLAAYAKLSEQVRQQVGLVFVGDGASRQQLEEQAASIRPATIKFAGFVHRERLAAYYALAEMLALPTYTDTWGLVVNEAMACGLPVIVSRAAGCSVDLVTDKWNGLLISPGDVTSLTSAMSSLACRADLRVTMGSHSVQRISRYFPEEWAKAVAGAVQTTAGAGD